MRTYRKIGDFKRLNDIADYLKNLYFETVFIDEELLADAIEFYNSYFRFRVHAITREEAIKYAELGPRLNADLWKSMMPMDKDKMDFFYSMTPFYFFHDIIRFMDGIHLERAFEFMENNKDPILDFAGGTGGYSIFFASRGLDVTFCDSNILQYNWMLWVNEKRKLGIKIFNDPKELVGKKFNFVLASDIVEHVIDPGELMTFLKSLVEKGGGIFASELNMSGPDDLAPMHFKVQEKDNGIAYNVEENMKTLMRPR